MAEGDQNKSAESVATEEEEEQESLPETQTCRLCNKEVAEWVSFQFPLPICCIIPNSSLNYYFPSN